MNTFSIGESLKVGWRTFMQRPWYLLGVSLAVWALFILSLGEAVVTALAYILFGGYIALAFKHFDGKQVQFDDLFSLDSRWISFAFVSLIKAVLIFLGLLCLIVPGIYLMVRWLFAEYLVIDQGMKPIEALRASSELTKGNRWKLFWYSVVVCILLLLGLLVFIVGAVVVWVVVLFATISIYNKLKAN